MKAESHVPPNTTRWYGPGQVCLDAAPGDLVLVRHNSLVAKGIRAFERLRVPADFCWANHAAVTVSGGPNASVSQEGGHGDVLTPIAELGAETYTVTHFDMDDTQRIEVIRFARWAVGHGYGFLSIGADAFNALTSLELGLGTGNRMVCSTMATRALERGGLIPDRTPYAVTPAHLAQYADAVLPTPIMQALAGAKKG